MQSKSCSWPKHHDDVKKLEDTGEYMGALIVDNQSEKGPSVTRSSRASANQAGNVRGNVLKQVMSLISRLEKDLRDQVFSDGDKVMIEDTRLITDLKTSAIRIKARGSILISNIEGANYITMLRKIIPSIKEVPDETMHYSPIPGIVSQAKWSKTKRKKILTAKSLWSYFCAARKNCTKALS